MSPLSQAQQRLQNWCIYCHIQDRKNRLDIQKDLKSNSNSTVTTKKKSQRGASLKNKHQIFMQNSFISRGLTQAAEHLLSKCEALSSTTPSKKIPSL
jgi:mannitol-1-phosphate/altronate dehydrogenase